MTTAAVDPAPFDGFPSATFRFLAGLTKHNTKEWFEQNRELYEAGYIEPARSFVAALGPRLQKFAPGIRFEPKVSGSLFRINRDVRFSKDKTPYKNHVDLWFWHGDRRGWETPGCFFRMFADRVITGTGMHQFDQRGPRHAPPTRQRPRPIPLPTPFERVGKERCGHVAVGRKQSERLPHRGLDVRRDRRSREPKARHRLLQLAGENALR